MRKLKWYLKQLLPFKYDTTHWTMDGRRKVVIWNMWLGRVFNQKHYYVKG